MPAENFRSRAGGMGRKAVLPDTISGPPARGFGDLYDLLPGLPPWQDVRN